MSRIGGADEMERAVLRRLHQLEESDTDTTERCVYVCERHRFHERNEIE